MSIKQGWKVTHSLSESAHNITGGSIHFTPGQAYDECDNGNRSAVHWDLVRVLTDGGEIWFDDFLIQKNGVFIHKNLLELNPA